MSSISTRDESDALIINIVEPSALNDFRSNTFRDSLYEAVRKCEHKRVAFDLSRVDFLSSSGVAILVGMKRRLDQQEGKFVIFGVQPIVQDLLRITRLHQYFTFADNETEARAALRPLPTA